MATQIRIEKIDTAGLDRREIGCTGKELMAGEIPGVLPRWMTVWPRTTCTSDYADGKSHILIFLAGSGYVTQAGQSWKIDELSVFVPRDRSAAEISAEDELQYLELILDRSDEDRKELEQRKPELPWFAAYSGCRRYQEAFKSPKTVNRTIVPDGLLPRFCMGSVQTAGPDRVGEHQHPMLEQFFFGLPGNRCRVLADGTPAEFGGNELLHIPLGSSHGAEVDERHELHYLWMDFFRNREGIDQWIKKMHTDVDGEGT